MVSVGEVTSTTKSITCLARGKDGTTEFAPAVTAIPSSLALSALVVVVATVAAVVVKGGRDNNNGDRGRKK